MKGIFQGVGAVGMMVGFVYGIFFPGLVPIVFASVVVGVIGCIM